MGYNTLRCGMRSKFNDKLTLLIEDLRGGESMCEVGSFAGESTLYFLKSGKFKELHAVDPWQVETNYTGFAEVDVERLKKMYSDVAWAEWSFDQRVNGYNVIKHKSTLSQCFNELPKFDFIYLDSDYRFEPFCKDIELALKLIKPNGQIGGHMYDKAQTREAIHKYFPNVKTYPDTSWLGL
jgi:predicted O-methyltransferase YrrM